MVPVGVPGITILTSVVPVLDTVMAATPAMLHADRLLRLVPVIVTSVPAGPLAGEKLLIVGACAHTAMPASSITAIISLLIVIMFFILVKVIICILIFLLTIQKNG
jgi:hypothetical protein